MVFFVTKRDQKNRKKHYIMTARLRHEQLRELGHQLGFVELYDNSSQVDSKIITALLDFYTRGPKWIRRLQMRWATWI